MNNDKPRQLREILDSIQSRTTAGAAVWRQHVEKNARIGESWEEASERLRREKEAARANPAPEHEKKEAETPAKLFLPGFDIGAFPNHLNRSSLFAPVARGKRKFHNLTAMVSRGDCVLEYTGEQLDEADSDVIMALVFFAQRFPMGTSVPLNRAELLRKIGRNTGKSNYEWLHRCLKRLAAATMFIEARKYNGSIKYKVGRMVKFSMIKEIEYSDHSESYSYILDPRWVVLYGNKEYSLIDWSKRLQIGRGQDMAKTLQRLIATSSDAVQYYSIEWLKEKMEYSGRVRDFKNALSSSCEELKRLEIIVSWAIENSTREQKQIVLKTPKSKVV